MEDSNVGRNPNPALGSELRAHSLMGEVAQFLNKQLLVQYQPTSVMIFTIFSTHWHILTPPAKS